MDAQGSSSTHSALVDDELCDLTRSLEKRSYYRTDRPFLEGHRDMRSSGNSVECVLALGGLLLRPDAFLARGVGRMLRLVRARSFVPVAFGLVRLDRRQLFEAWRYQLNTAHAERIEAMELVLCDAPSLYVVMRRVTETALGREGAPASVELTAMKGSSRPEDRLPGTLRWSFGGTSGNSVVTYVHTSDEPADLVRELAIFLSPFDRRRIWDAAQTGRDVTPDLARQVVEIERELPPRRLEARVAFGRLRTSSHADRWDDAAIACEFAQTYLPGAFLIPDVSAAEWGVGNRGD